MRWKSTIIILAVMALFDASGLTAASECTAADKIDGSTADSARKKIEDAGYRQVHDLEKGCDNFWHGQASKDGRAVNIVLSPQGKVMVEGN